MEILFIVLTIPAAFWGLTRFNQHGAFGAHRTNAVLGALALLIGLVCWMTAMGSLRGVFAFLGFLTLLGLVLSYRIGTKLKTPL